MRRCLAVPLSFVCLVFGCTRSTNLATSKGGPDAAVPLDAGGSDAAPADASRAETGPVFRFDDAGVVLCGTHACACSDGKDNDDDHLFDGFDPECTGPFDD